jgi:hypothetical protein
MRRLSILAMMVAALLLVAGAASAQSTPNFTGKWTIVPDPNAPPPAGGGAGGGGRGGAGGRGGGRGGAVAGPEVTITQDATTLKVERVQGQNTVTMSYTIGGEGKNTMPAGRQGGNPAEVPYKTAWEGNKFVITSTTTMMGQDGNPMTMTSKQALSIAADGTLLVENTSTPMGGGDPVTTKVTYKKN